MNPRAACPTRSHRARRDGPRPCSSRSGRPALCRRCLRSHRCRTRVRVLPPFETLLSYQLEDPNLGEKLRRRESALRPARGPERSGRKIRAVGNLSLVRHAALVRRDLTAGCRSTRKRYRGSALSRRLAAISRSISASLRSDLAPSRPSSASIRSIRARERSSAWPFGGLGPPSSCQLQNEGLSGPTFTAF